MSTAPRRRQPERAIQAQGVRLLKTLGAAVWTIGTTRRKGDYMGTMQTPGLPDVLAFLPVRGLRERRLLVWEAKAPKGRLRPEQAEFRDQCLFAGVAHVVGGTDALVAWLVQERYLHADQVPHYYTATKGDAA